MPIWGEATDFRAPLAREFNLKIDERMDRTDLQRLSKDELIELVIELQRPDKTSRNSSKPLPRTRRQSARTPVGAKPGHEPHDRWLADNPDEIRDHKPTRCAQCGGAFSSDADMELIGEYDEIEIPPVKRHVVRHRRFACRCAHCGAGMKAPAPAVATTTPFGPRIHALAIYCKSFQALSYERLRFLFRDAFGLIVSEGALMNMFIRSHAGFEIEAGRRSPFFARPGLSPATKPACGSKGPTPIIGCFTARMRSCIGPITRAAPARGRDDGRP